MNISFGESLRRLRIEKGFSQQQLADKVYVDRSTVAHWESGRRLPDVSMIALLSDILDTDVAVMLRIAEKNDEKVNVLMLDDEKIILDGGMPILKQVMPEAEITGFTRPSDAIAFAGSTRIDMAFVDIEMGRISGLDVCRALLAVNPATAVIYLTAYMDYSFDAWQTGARGFMMKPLTAEDLRRQMTLLRYPIGGSGE